MAKSMFPSDNALTDGQIGKFQELIGAALRKRRGDFQSAPAQTVLTLQARDLRSEVLAVFLRRVDALSDMIIRHVKVDRSLTPQQMLNATGRGHYTDQEIVETMPHGEGEETDVYFFRAGRYVTDEELEKEYALRGLKPADPYSLARVNTDDLAFTDEYQNCTHWKDTKGNWCYINFHHDFNGDRRVDIRRLDGARHADYWFAGVKVSTSQAAQ